MITTVCPPEHKHSATSTCYGEHQCRCVDCRSGNNARKRDAYRKRAYGIATAKFVDAAPVREHVEHLRAFGMGARQIATTAGVSLTCLEHLIWGHAIRTPRRYRPPTPSHHISPANAAAILAVKPDPTTMLGNTRIPARGAHRRVQALVTQGWTMNQIGVRIGMSANGISRLLQQDLVYAKNHRELASVFEDLWNERPPRDTRVERGNYLRSVRHAADRRWLPPLAWDDIDNDPTPPVADHDFTVDEMAVELACSGERVRLNPAERREVVRLLHPRRWSDTRIADFADCDARTVLRIRQDLGLAAFDQNDLIDRNAA